MYVRRTLLTLLLTLFFCFPLYLISRPFAPLIELRRTGGDFPGEGVCAMSGCHVGTANSGPGSVSLTVQGTPIEQFEYTPGETVPVLVRIVDPTARRWGFQMSARTPDGCQQAGTFQPGEAAVTVRTDTAAFNPCPQASIEFPVHTAAKAGSNEVTFAVNWTAPGENFGPLVFAAAGNAANGNNQSTGDNIYTTQATVQPAAGGGGQDPPAISSGGVVLGNLLPTVTSISPNAIISIFGANFAPAGTADIQPELDAQGRVAVNQNGVCVEINGERSPILHLFPSQLNLQAPTTAARGPVSVEVISGCDTATEQRSAAEIVTVENLTPAVFVLTSFADAEGRAPVAAQHADFSFVGDPATLQGLTPARAGEFIIFYATGLGPTTPALQAGEIPQTALPNLSPPGAAPLADPGAFSMMIGEMGVSGGDVFYVGSSPCCAGLYQIIGKVPESLPDGEHEVLLSVDGTLSGGGPFVTVRSP